MTPPPTRPQLFTVGHSNQTAAEFVALLRRHNINTIIDVRSAPYSRYCPQFNKPALAPVLADAGIQYVYLGDKLGGMPRGEHLYDADGSPLYERISMAPFFVDGIQRLVDLLPTARCAMMCAEENPRHCHRHRLVEPALAARGVDIRHIRADDRIESSHEIDAPADGQMRLF